VTEEKPKEEQSEEGKALSAPNHELPTLQGAWLVVRHELLWLCMEAFGLVATEAIIKVTFWLLERIHGTPFPVFVETIVLIIQIIVFLAIILVAGILHLTRLGDAVRSGWREYIEKANPDLSAKLGKEAPRRDTVPPPPSPGLKEEEKRP
jgi:hypothetical protein